MNLIRLRQLRGWVARLCGLFQRARREREFAEELESHLALHIEDNLRAGMSPDEARRVALIKLGGVTLTKQLHREQRGVPMLETLWQDLRFGLRILRKNPGFSVIAVLTLALGLGANTAIFSVVNAVLLRPLPYPEPEQLVVVREFSSSQPNAQAAPGNFIEWQQQNSLFSQIEAYRNVSYNLTGDGVPERILAGRASSGLFTMLGVHPSLGRDFLSEEDQPGGNKVALISHGLWQRRFGRDTNVIGRMLRLSGESFAVIGVLPETFRLPDLREREVWTPLALSSTERQLRAAHYLEAIARLKPNVSLAHAQSEMDAIGEHLAQQYPNENGGWSIKLTGLQDYAVLDLNTVLWTLFVTVGFVLLIACVNVANLLLARAAARQKEIAVRIALGATRSRIVRQLLAESGLLALLGGLAGLPLAWWALQALLAAAPQGLLRQGLIAIDLRVLFFTLGITLVTALIFGLAPALQFSKSDLNSSLKDGRADGNQGAQQRRIGDLLVVAEVALALVLLIGGGLLMRTFWEL